MKQIVFNDKTYNIPTEWGDVTLQMLIRSSELVDLLPDAPIIAIISAYTGIPIDQLKESHIAEVNSIIVDLGFVTVPYEPKPNNEFRWKNCKYSSEIDLVNQSFGDWVSVQTALNNFKDEPEKALPRMMAILCKKDGEKLDDFNLNERTTEFMELPMTVAKDVEAFFLLSKNAYNAIILLSSTEKEQEELVLIKLQELQNIMKKRKAELGIFSPTRLLIGIYQIYLNYLEQALVKFFNSQVSNQPKKTYIQTLKKLVLLIQKQNIVRITKDHVKRTY